MQEPRVLNIKAIIKITAILMVSLIYFSLTVGAQNGPEYVKSKVDLISIGKFLRPCHRQYNPFYIRGYLGLRCDMKGVTIINKIKINSENIFLLSKDLFLYVDPHTPLDGQLYRNKLLELKVDGSKNLDFKNTIRREGPEDPRYFLGQNNTVYLQYTAPNPLKEMYPSLLMWIAPLSYFTKKNDTKSIVSVPTPIFYNSSQKISEEKNWMFFMQESSLYALYSSEPYQLMRIENENTRYATKSYYKNHSCVSFWANATSKSAVHLGSNLIKIQHSIDLDKFGINRDVFLGISHLKYWNENAIGYYKDVYVFYDSVFPFAPFMSIFYTPEFYNQYEFVYSSSINIKSHPAKLNTTLYIGYGKQDDGFGFHDIELAGLLKMSSTTC